MRRGGEGDKLDGTKLEAKGRNRRGEEVRGVRARRGGGLFRRLCRGVANTNDLSVSLSAGPVSAGGGKHVSERGGNQGVPGSYARRLSGIRSTLSQQTHTHTRVHIDARKGASLSSDHKSPLFNTRCIYMLQLTLNPAVFPGPESFPLLLRLRLFSQLSVRPSSFHKLH